MELFDIKDDIPLCCDGTGKRMFGLTFERGSEIERCLRTERLDDDRVTDCQCSSLIKDDSL